MKLRNIIRISVNFMGIPPGSLFRCVKKDDYDMLRCALKNCGCGFDSLFRRPTTVGVTCQSFDNIKLVDMCFKCVP